MKKILCSALMALGTNVLFGATVPATCKPGEIVSKMHITVGDTTFDCLYKIEGGDPTPPKPALLSLVDHKIFETTDSSDAAISPPKELIYRYEYVQKGGKKVPVLREVGKEASPHVFRVGEGVLTRSLDPIVSQHIGTGRGGVFVPTAHRPLIDMLRDHEIISYRINYSA